MISLTHIMKKLVTKKYLLWNFTPNNRIQKSKHFLYFNFHFQQRLPFKKEIFGLFELKYLLYCIELILAEIYFVILNDGQTLVWGGVSLGVLNLTITLFNKLGDSKNAKTVFWKKYMLTKQNVGSQKCSKYSF